MNTSFEKNNQALRSKYIKHVVFQFSLTERDFLKLQLYNSYIER